MVVLHEVFLQRVLSVDFVHWTAHIVLLGVNVSRQSGRGLGHSALTVSVAGEDLGKGVAHLQLTIESSVEEGLIRVETAILQSSLSSRRKRVVVIFVWQSSFEVIRVHCQWRQLSQSFSISTVFHKVSSASVRNLLLRLESLER